MSGRDCAVEALLADGSWAPSPLGPCGQRASRRGRVAEQLVEIVAAFPAEPVRATDSECICPYPNPRWGDTSPSCELHGRCFETARVEMAEHVRRADLLADELARETKLRREAERALAADREPTYPAGSRRELIQAELLGARTRIICDLDLTGALGCIGRALNALAEGEKP